MQIKKVAILGGSGFVGSAVVAKLAAAGYFVTVLTRRYDVAKHLILLPNVSLLECNILDYHALNSALRGMDAVINLVGILHQSRRVSFNTMHQQLPTQLAKICADLGIRRLLHMSSLQAANSAPSQYLRSKAAGESALLAFSNKLNITIFKPSIIFGRGDRFINLFATLIKFLPAILLAKPNAKFQPIWVEDVASCFVNSLENTATFGQSFELAGPTDYTFRELVQQVMHTLGLQRPIIGLNDTLSYAQAFMMELLPIKLMSRDNVRSMEIDSVSQKPIAAILGVHTTALEAVIAEYLVDQTSRGAYDRFRSIAAR
ncbi:MAG: complex I NDUFA9 subunit family protein [Methylotenera sp.]|nr:complex I NDUFA9 subunit family protein [Methylotenera sp.]MDO9232410.1 complex I NDUFA9 subunit family protein [Methylotenera sp.]MDO9389918.1 complex I NDUFA9 subunit family protein [Methylotenera sp.]MDP2101498.1 complex I NDUFA9 subunit family protein [Methylotenera sp.]MDP2281932.1 complex I NDUFA9 subunit family protein [Methylotenera sp.]